MANFSSPRANVVEGDNGVSIEVLGRTGIRYSEPGRSCLVDSEVLATPAVAVWPSGIRGRDPPHADAPLTDYDRRRILQSIADAFASQGWGLEVIDPPTDDDRRRILQEIADAVPTQEWSVEIIGRRDSGWARSEDIDVNGDAAALTWPACARSRSGRLQSRPLRVWRLPVPLPPAWLACL